MLGKVYALVVLSQSSASKLVAKLVWGGEEKVYDEFYLGISILARPVAMRANGGEADGQ